MKLQKLIAAALALALGLGGTVNADINTRKRFPLVVSKTSTATYTYCLMLGESGSKLGAWKTPKPTQLVKTSGSSTTVAEVTDTDPYNFLLAGDLIRFNGPKASADNERLISTRTSASSSVMNRPIDLDPSTDPAGVTGYSFEYLTRSCSTTITAQYIPINTWQAGNFLLVAEAESSATSGLDYKLVCYVDGASQFASIVASGNVTQAEASAGKAVVIGEFNIGNYGFTNCALGVTSSAGNVTYSAYFIAKNLDGGN